MGVTAYEPVAGFLAPFVWRGKTIPSRLALAPINTGYTDGNGNPSARMIRFHVQRSGKGIGISMVGNVAVEPHAKTSADTAVLSAETDIRGFAELAAAISSHGSLPGIQLANAPRALSPPRNWRAANRSQEVARLREIVSGYGTKEVTLALAQFIQSARLAVLAGFEVIQLHAAHGYLISLLLHPATNFRKDEYSQSSSWFERLLFELRLAIGDALLSVRLSVCTGILEDSEELAWAKDTLRRASEVGVDILDLSAGFYTIDRQLIYPDRKWDGPVYRNWLSEISGDLPQIIAVVGRITDLNRVQSPLPVNPMLNLGRALIADPDFVDKTRGSGTEEITSCRLKNRCHYFSRGVPALECGVNPNL